MAAEAMNHYEPESAAGAEFKFDIKFYLDSLRVSHARSSNDS
jgi:hypothetical protein